MVIFLHFLTFYVILWNKNYVIFVIILHKTINLIFIPTRKIFSKITPSSINQLFINKINSSQEDILDLPYLSLFIIKLNNIPQQINYK